MILIPILTVIWLAVRLHTDYKQSGEPDSYEAWKNEPETKLEIVK